MPQQPNNCSDFKTDVKQLTWPLRFFVAAMSGLDRLVPQLTTHLMLNKFVTPRRKRSNQYESQLPAGAQRLAIEHQNQTLVGWCWPATGPTVLVIHGWESHTGRMAPLVASLLDQGYQVLALDAPGHGLSPQAKTNLHDVGEAIRAMIKQHGPVYGIVAHSFGAAATAVLLARHPELMPQKLVFLSPMRDLAQHLEIFAGIAQLSPASQARLTKQVERRLGLALESNSAVAAVRTFTRPGLIIHDQDDRLIPPGVGEAIAQNWAGSRFILTRRLGHRRVLRNAQVMAHIAGYLAEESGRQTAVSRRPAPVEVTYSPHPFRWGLNWGELPRATAV